jgi:hypothetical protein
VIRARRISRRRSLLTLGAVVGLSAVGCATAPPVSADARLLARPERDEWPERFWRSPSQVQTAYRYAVASGDDLRFVPCYCGCVADGHTSNLDCYVREVGPSGTVLDPHGFG